MSRVNIHSLQTTVVATLYLLLSACGGDGSGINLQTAGGSTAPVTYVTLEVDGAPYNGNLLQGDFAYFNFNATLGETYTVQLQTHSGDADVQIASDASGQNIVGGSINNGTADDLVTINGATATTYYVEVSGFLASSYTVQIHTGLPNLGPTIYNLTLSPTQPRSSDDLTLAYSTSDPEGDPLTETITWYRNGIELAGQTSATLPSQYFQRDDVIRGRVTVSDAGSSVSLHVEATILDSPPQFNFVLPASISPGSPLSINLGATDADGDVVTYELLFGPEGMTIDSEGNLGWTPGVSGYFPIYDVNWSVRIRSNGATSDYAGTLRVSDAGRNDPLARSGIAIPTRHNGLDVGDFDQDGKMELLITDNAKRLYTMEFDGTSYVQDWMYPFDLAPGQGISAVKAKDIDGDGIPEIVIGTGKRFFSQGSTAHLRVINGATRRVIAEIDTGAVDMLALEVGDIDNDGVVEIVALLATETGFNPLSRIVVLNARSLATEWDSGAEAFGAGMAIGNFDSSPTLEIATSAGYVFGIVNGGYVNRWLASGGFGDHVAAGDIDGDGIDEIIAADEDVRVYSLVTRNLRWHLEGATTYLVYGALHVGNIDIDPEDEIIVGESQWGDVISISYDPVGNSLVEDWRFSSQNHGVSGIVIGDLDTDGSIELVWASGASSSGADSLVVAGFAPDITIEWISYDGNTSNPDNVPQLDGPFVGGYWHHRHPDQAGALFGTATTYNGYGGSRLIVMDASTGRLSLSSEIGNNWNGKLALGVTDYNGDGTDEIVIATSELYTGYSAIYDFASDSITWTSPLNQGVGQAIAVGDLNGDSAPDFAVATDTGFIRAHDPLTQSLIWSNGGQATYVYDVEISDLDGDGVAELIAAVRNNVIVFEAVSGGYTPRYTTTFQDVTDIAVGDIDGDGFPEIAAASAGTMLGNNGRIRLFDAQLDVLSDFSVGEDLAAIFLDKAAAGGNLILSFHNGYFAAESISYLSWVTPISGNEVHRSPLLLGPVQKNSLRIVDVDNDGRDDLIMGAGQAMYITR